MAYTNSPIALANQFPVILSTGALARYPMARSRKYATKQIDFADFSRQTAPLLSTALMNWDVTLAQLTDSEIADCSAFFDAQQGSYGTFTFIDPWDNLLKYSEEFENSVWLSGGAGGMYVGENYLLNSQNFSQSSWGVSNTGSSNATITPNSQTAPDGTVTASEIAFPSVPNTSGDFSQVLQVTTPPVVPSQEFTFSIWIKGAAACSIILLLQDSPYTQAHGLTVSVTTSWQRLSVTGTFSSGANSSISAGLQAGANFSATNVYVWGAQLEYGATASDYTVTTTATAPLEIADPFFQQAPTTVPGYQWNLNSLYPRRGRQLVITENSNPIIYQKIGIYPGATGKSLTASLYVKAQSGSAITLPWPVVDQSYYEGSTTILNPTSSWVRVQMPVIFSQSNPSSSMIFAIGGDGTSALGTFYVFGAQLEVEGVASDYKQTQAVSGVHPTCYINTDEYAQIASEFDVNVFENSMRQRRSTLSQLSDVLTINECNAS